MNEQLIGVLAFPTLIALMSMFCGMLLARWKRIPQHLHVMRMHINKTKIFRFGIDEFENIINNLNTYIMLDIEIYRYIYIYTIIHL